MNKLTRVKSAVISGAIALSSLAAPLSSAVSPSLSATAAGGDNYAKLLQYSLYLYDANMCGNNSDCGLSWRGNCHMNDDVVGGFHDAGDHVMFGQPQGYTASTLGWAYYEFKDAFEETGQGAHLKVITDRFAKFFRDATVLNGGNVSKVLIEKGEGNQDHDYWGAPETQGDRGRMVWTTGGAANITAEYAAALAANYVNFGNPDDLTYAKALYNFSKQNTGTYSVSPFYVSGTSGSADELAWAAGWLYKATNDQQYLNDLNNAPEGWWVHCWENVGLGAAILKAEATNNWSAVHEIGGDSSYKFYDEWGSARHNATAQMATLVAAKYNHGDASWAKGQMEYLTGDKPFANGRSYCLIVGFKDNASKNPHHRASSPDANASEQNDGIQNKNLLVGALCGGPTSANGDGYRDVRSDYKANEVACDYNAGLVGAAAGLFHFYKTGSIDSTITGVTKIYNGGASTPTPGTTTTTTAPPYNPTTTTTSPGPGPSTGGGKTLLPADMKVGTEDGTDGPISYAEFSPQGAKKATLYFKINTSDTQASGGFGTWTGKWEQVDFENVKADANKEVVVDYDIPSNVGATVKAMIWWPQGDGVTIEKVVLDGGGSSTPTPVTTTTTTAPPYNPPATTTTPAPSTGGNGVYKVELNKSLKFDDAADDKMIGFDWADFKIPSGEYATKVEFNISASSNIDKWVGNFGSSTTVAPDYWYMNDDDQLEKTINSNKGTITWSPSASAAKTFAYSGGELKFGTWWTNVSSYTMDSIVVYTAKGAAATTTTVKPIVTTTTTTTTAPPYNPPTTTTTTTITTPPTSVNYGDANCDGKMELADAILIMQALANPNKYGVNGSDPKHLTEQGKLNGDVDRRTTGLTSNDALTIQQYLLHIIYTLPIV